MGKSNYEETRRIVELYANHNSKHAFVDENSIVEDMVGKFTGKILDENPEVQNQVIEEFKRQVVEQMDTDLPNRDELIKKFKERLER